MLRKINSSHPCTRSAWTHERFRNSYPDSYRGYSEYDLEEIRDITISLRTDATNLYTLLENLLEWSRLKRGVMEFNPEKFNLKTLIASGIESVSASARKKKIVLDLSVPYDLEVFADRHMFETVVRNLVSNAVKFTPVNGKVNVSGFQKQG